MQNLTHFCPERKQTEIKLSNQQFDRFIKACQDTTLKPSKEILAAAKLLDVENWFSAMPQFTDDFMENGREPQPQEQVRDWGKEFKAGELG